MTAVDKKLAGASKDSFTKKCVNDASETKNRQQSVFSAWQSINRTLLSVLSCVQSERGNASFQLLGSGRFGADCIAVRCGCNAGTGFAGDSHQPMLRFARVPASRCDTNANAVRRVHN